MKNNYKLVLAICVSMVLAGGCGLTGGANIANSAISNKNAGTSNEPAIEITAAALVKEWVADRKATDAKYEGKQFSITGKLFHAESSDGKAFVDIVGVPVNANEPADESVRVGCVGNVTDVTRSLVKTSAEYLESRRTKPNAKPAPAPKLRIKGRYTGISQNPRLIDISDCSVEIEQ